MGCEPRGIARRAVVLVVAMLLLACPALASTSELEREPSAKPTTPKATVDALHSVFLDVMKRAIELGFDGRLIALTGPVEKTFDLEFMALKTIGEGRKKLDGEGRARWVASFGNFLLSNYARRFDGWSGQTFETLSDEPAPRNTVVVRTRLIRPKDEDVELDYRLRPTEAGWLIIDIYSNGSVSELALRRSEFSSLFKETGLDGLVSSVDKKAAQR